MEKYFEVLEKCPLFSGINKEDLKRLLSCLGVKIIHFDKKYTILAEGSPALYVGILLSGSAIVEKVDYFGNRSIVDTVFPSELFGEDFSSAEIGSLPVSVVSSEPCEVMLIECSHILYTCHKGCGFHHTLIYNLMRIMAKKAIEYSEKIDVTSRRTTREKLLAYLAAEAKRQGSSSFTIPFDRQELADYLEVERSGLSSEIGKLKKEGVIDSKKRSFALL